ncbi:hypothetical protein AKAW_00344 [Aspergillus niger]|uniref:Uncharacterized protein n=2 Tax=Aspergillus subgen. Circumdati TaxID=2720871 RepID=A0A100IHQ4_ASPNG|nr:hypothetical protein AKAW_00344 [Aspergillus niger]
MSFATPLDKAEILLEADEFVTRYNLHDSRDLIRKGALLSYDPHDYARADGLTDDEITALQDDKVELSRSNISLFRALAGLLYVVLIASLPLYKYSAFWQPSSAHYPGVLLVVIQLLEHPLAALLSNGVGRRQALRTASTLAILRACLAFLRISKQYSRRLELAFLNIDRLFVGVALATLSFNMPLHLAEYAPASVRGRAMLLWPLVVGLFDLLMRSLLLPVFMPTPRDVTQINIVIIPIAISFSFSLRHMTLESPYQCIAQGHMASSLQALYKARPSKIVAARDLYRIYATSPLESSRASQSARRAIIYSVTIMLAFVLIVPLNLNLDSMRFVRFCMQILLSTGLSAVATVYAVEILPYRCRDKGYAITVSVYNTVRVLVQLIDLKPYYPFRYPDGGPRPSDLTTALCRIMHMCAIAVATGLTHSFMRETARIPLEDMEKLFEARDRDTILYQMTIVWPYLFKRYVLWQNVALEPFEESQYGAGAIALT